MTTARHQGAIAMAQVERRQGKDLELWVMARDIVAIQEEGIARMKAWIAAYRQAG